MKNLGQFMRERRKALGLRGREVAAAVRKADGTPISIPYLVDLEYGRRKPSDPVLQQFAKVCRWTPTCSISLKGGARRICRWEGSTRRRSARCCARCGASSRAGEVHYKHSGQAAYDAAQAAGTVTEGAGSALEESRQPVSVVDLPELPRKGPRPTAGLST